MCGIVGYIGPKKAVPIILDGLKHLEYRGYDSAGIAVLQNGDGVAVRRAPGKLRNLEDALRQSPIDGPYGIGHTRWATHGRPTEQNAHPHRDCKGDVVVVHNGIVENHLELKQELISEGHSFTTETDTEVIAHLVEKHFHRNLEDAVRHAVRQLKGVFALSVISRKDPYKIVAARQGPPIVVGLGDSEYFLASDVPALLSHTREVLYLADGDIAILTPSGVCITDFTGRALQRQTSHISWNSAMAERGGYRHFMLKEIHEQPHAVRETTLGRVREATGRIVLDEVGLSTGEIRAFHKVRIVACGSSWHAALVGKFVIERLARIPVEVDYGSEFRYRDPIIGPDTLTVVISQSGETADTLAAQREAKGRGSKTLAICNVVGSMVTREAVGTIITHAGPEIGVASTKAFTAQLTALCLLATHLGQVRDVMSSELSKKLIDGLVQLPCQLEDVLRRDSIYEGLAQDLFRSPSFLYLGRGVHFPTALEGALKLKEISYIHAEGYPAGEMKHGPNALIDSNLPTVVLATCDQSDTSSLTLREKTLSNMQEVKAREGEVIAVACDGDSEVAKIADRVITIPQAHELLLPILEVVPLQLLAYHIAVKKGCDVDQPRNLAKSVTVE